MKKMILSATALMFCAALSAQVDDKDGNTVGPGVPNFIMPTGIGNVGQSNQTGANHGVSVVQIGSEQSVFTNQTNGTAGTGAHQAYVRQVGDDNVVEVDQTDTANESYTHQYGNLNVAYTSQAGGSTDRNKANIRQGDSGAGNDVDGNFGWIEQRDGSSHQARVRQLGDNSDALIIQEGGDDNQADIQQETTGTTEGHEGYIHQEGNGNVGHIDQDPGSGARNEATSLQTGDGNFSFQEQTTNAFVGGVGNTAVVNQGDQSPTAAGSLYDETDYDGLGGGLFDVQPNALNSGSIDGIAFQHQQGSDNDAEIHQFSDTDSNYAQQDQNGSGNDALIVQNAYSNNTAGGNMAWQDQSHSSNPSGNAASIVQNGAGNMAFQEQKNGNDNEIHSFQSFRNNQVWALQSGDDNYGLTGQRGHDNETLLVQRGDGNSYIVTQNSAGFGFNNGNVANILQVGPNNPSTYTTVSTPVSFPVKQNSDNTTGPYRASGVGDLLPVPNPF